MTNFLIKMSFEVSCFQVLRTTSLFISGGRWEELENLLTPEAVEEIKINYEKLNFKQQEEIAVPEHFPCMTVVNNVKIINDSGNAMNAEKYRLTFVYFFFVFRTIIYSTGDKT